MKDNEKRSKTQQEDKNNNQKEINDKDNKKLDKNI